MQVSHITKMWGMSWIVIKDLNGECAIPEQTDLKLNIWEFVKLFNDELIPYSAKQTAWLLQKLFQNSGRMEKQLLS